MSAMKHHGPVRLRWNLSLTALTDRNYGEIRQKERAFLLEKDYYIALIQLGAKDTESPFIACLRGISAAKDAIRAA